MRTLSAGRPSQPPIPVPSARGPSGRFSCRLGSRVALALFLSFATVAVSAQFLAPGPSAFAEGTEAKEGARRRTFFDNVKAGGWIGHTIILCSIVGVSLSLAYAFQIRRDALVPPELLAQVEQLFEDEDYEEAFHVCEANPCYFSAILTAGLAKLDEGYDEMQKAMMETGEAETTKLYQKISWISLIAAVSPMLGLFGTVSGMIRTFNIIASSDVQPKPADLADGISQALVTTYEGLLVAIPMTVVYAAFRYRISNAVVEVGAIVEELTSRFKAPSASA
ncbi:MAG: MotA/TolQ/ExbB proton channel family protein [Planctomycetota bacterium]